MDNLRPEHGGALGILLILHAIQVYLKPSAHTYNGVNIWIDNTEVLYPEAKNQKWGTA